MIDQLEQRVKVLKDWKESRTRERFRFPLDEKSQEILDRNNLTFTGKTYTTGAIELTDLIAFGAIIGTRSNRKVKVAVSVFPLYSFTTDASTNIITYSAGFFLLHDNDTIVITSSGVYPGGLDSTTTYYIISATATTFKVSLTEGGAEINITTNGSGSHYFSIY